MEIQLSGCRMEHLNHPHCGELLSHGKVARAETFPCGHIVLTFENFKIGFAREDFADFANTVAMAASHLACRDNERAQWPWMD